MNSEVEGFHILPIDKLRTAEDRLRLSTNEEYITELAKSIKSSGHLQPILVRPLKSGNYEIVAGKQRYLATKRAGLKTIPCIVKEMENSVYTKSGVMLGMGEEEHEVIQAFADLRAAGCDFLSIGQYLMPSRSHFPVQQYIEPDSFLHYKEKAVEMGFRHVVSSPYARSSYHAAEYIADN